MTVVMTAGAELTMVVLPMILVITLVPEVMVAKTGTTVEKGDAPGPCIHPFLV